MKQKVLYIESLAPDGEMESQQLQFVSERGSANLDLNAASRRLRTEFLLLHRLNGFPPLRHHYFSLELVTFPGFFSNLNLTRI